MNTSDVLIKYKQLISDIIAEQLPKYLEVFLESNKLVKPDNTTVRLTNNILELIHADTNTIHLVSAPSIACIQDDYGCLISMSSSSLLYNTPIVMYHVTYNDRTTSVSAIDGSANVYWSDVQNCPTISVVAEDTNGNISDPSYIDMTTLVQDNNSSRPISIDMRAHAISVIELYVNKSIEQGFTFTTLIDNVSTSLHVDYTQLDQNNITDSLILAIINEKFSTDKHVTYITGAINHTSSYQGSMVTMQLDMQELLRLFIEAMGHKQMCVIEGQLLKQKVEQSTTDEQLYDIIKQLQ